MKFLADPQKRRPWVLIPLKRTVLRKVEGQGRSPGLYLSASLPAYQRPDS